MDFEYDINNMYVDNNGELQKIKTNNTFWSLIIMLYRLNRSNKKWRTKNNYTITLPVKWI